MRGVASSPIALRSPTALANSTRTASRAFCAFSSLRERNLFLGSFSAASLAAFTSVSPDSTDDTHWLTSSFACTHRS